MQIAEKMSQSAPSALDVLRVIFLADFERRISKEAKCG